jgi:hypothetical protein
VFGLASGNTIGELTRAYNPATGDWWLLVVVVTGMAPWLGAKIRQRLTGGAS